MSWLASAAAESEASDARWQEAVQGALERARRPVGVAERRARLGTEAALVHRDDDGVALCGDNLPVRHHSAMDHIIRTTTFTMSPTTKAPRCEGASAMLQVAWRRQGRRQRASTHRRDGHAIITGTVHL